MSPDARPVVIALRGLKGAGKSDLARALATRLGWPVVAIGDVVRQWAVAANGFADAESVRRAADDARQTANGVMGKVLQTVWPQSAPPTRIVIDSVREVADVVSLRKIGYFIVVVTVFAPFETRLARITERARSDDRLSPSDLRAHDRWDRELSRGGTRGDFNIRVKSDRMDRLVLKVLKQLEQAGVIDAY